MVLKDKVVVITGAARGMGRAYVLGFLEEGAYVVASDRSWSGDGAEELQALITDSGRGITQTVDVTDQTAVDSACLETIEAFGTVDVLLNNAGMRQRDLFPPHGAAKVLEISDRQWRQMFDVNVFGTLNMIRAFVRPMVTNRTGSIINVSTTGTVPRYHRPHSREQPYMGSKSALTNISIYLAHELAENNIAVNVIFPPHALTTGTLEQDKLRHAMGYMGPVLSVPLVPEAVVPLAKHLAQQDAKTGITGHLITAEEWNEQQGLGAPEVWRASMDLA